MEIIDIKFDEMKQEHNDYRNDENFNFDELFELHQNDFQPFIKNRGYQYFYGNKVQQVVKNKDSYIAKVSGRNQETYHVNITYNEIMGELDYECSCPCDFPCKHIYATMLAIKNKHYKIVNLMPEIKEKEITLHELIEKIPAEEIKSYLLKDGIVSFDEKKERKFKAYFSKYLPEQSYDFYYNRLYNEIILDGEYDEVLKNYLSKVRNLILNESYQEALTICISIINAGHMADYLDQWEKFVQAVFEITMDFRIILRRGSAEIKESIYQWKNQLIQDNYYQSVYLEDCVESIE